MLPACPLGVCLQYICKVIYIVATNIAVLIFLCVSVVCVGRVALSEHCSDADSPLSVDISLQKARCSN